MLEKIHYLIAVGCGATMVVRMLTYDGKHFDPAAFVLVAIMAGVYLVSKGLLLVASFLDQKK